MNPNSKVSLKAIDYDLSKMVGCLVFWEFEKYRTLLWVPKFLMNRSNWE